MAQSSAARSNVQIRLAFHASETLATGTPRNLGFMVATDENGIPQYSVTDLAPAELIERVRAQGYECNENLEASFYKAAWNGPFGAYEERPEQNKPAHSDDVDLKGIHPVLCPKRYSIGFKTITASVTFQATTPGTITSATNLSEFSTGDTIVITGTVSNNGTYTVSTGGVAGTIRTTQATDAEGPVTATIRVSSTGTPQDIKPFGSNTYMISADGIFQLANWGTPGAAYWVRVNATGFANGRLHVHNGYLYACGSTYAYSADGTTWTNSNRGGTDQNAAEMITLRGVLHKRIGNNHYQLLAATDTGINGATAWTSADQIGDTSFAVAKMMSILDSLLFATSRGVLTLDGEGNVSDFLPNLPDMAGVVNGNGVAAWLNNSLIVPLANGSVKLYQDGAALPITPSSQVEGQQVVVTDPLMIDDLWYIAVAGESVYAAQVDDSTLYSNDWRLLELEQLGPRSFVWRSLFTKITSTVYYQIFGTYVPNTGNPGPVLWIRTSSATEPLDYIIVPLGRDAVQDARSRFVSSGVIYDPWITLGCPEVNKRWSYVEAAVTQSTPANFAKTTYALDAVNEAGTDVMAATFTMAQGITILPLNFDSNIISKRVRLTHTLGNTGTSQELETPILLWIRVHAKLLPTPKRAYDMTLLAPTAGVGHGVGTQEEARLFFNAMRSAKLPMTLSEPFGNASITVNPKVGFPQEVASTRGNPRPDEAVRLVLIEQPSGV